MPSEVEKLRVLLAEARALWVNWPPCRACLEPYCVLVRRIDSALAEPVAPEYTFHNDYIKDASGNFWWNEQLLTKTECERDEAWAEVERVRSVEAEKARGDAVLFRQRIAYLKAELDRSGHGYEERKPDEVADAAFKRGVEAMRQSAADYLEEDAKFESVSMSTAAEIYANVIRNLPIPEDK